jgi:hypothetical protein
LLCIISCLFRLEILSATEPYERERKEQAYYGTMKAL